MDPACLSVPADFNNGEEELIQKETARLNLPLDEVPTY